MPPGCPLSDREFEVVALQAEGYTYKEIGRQLCVEESTVRGHVYSARRRLGIRGLRRSGAVIVHMMRSGWLGAPPRQPQQVDDSRDATAMQRVFNEFFVRMCVTRSSRAVALVAVAYEILIRAEHGAPDRPVTDVDEMLLGMARAAMRPIP